MINGQIGDNRKIITNDESFDVTKINTIFEKSQINTDVNLF